MPRRATCPKHPGVRLLCPACVSEKKRGRPVTPERRAFLRLIARLPRTRTKKLAS